MTSTSPPAARLLSVSLATGLLLGALDVGHCMIREGFGVFGGLGALLASATATALAAALLHGLLWVILRAAVPPLRRLPAATIGALLGVFLGCAFGLALLAALPDRPVREAVPLWVVIGVASMVLAGVAALAIGNDATGAARRQRARSASVVVVVLLWELVLVAHGLGALARAELGFSGTLMATVGGGVVIAVSALGLPRWVKPTSAPRWHGVIALLLAFASVPFAWTIGRPVGREALAATPLRRPVPRVILLTVDTLRADVLGCYGASLETPHIDRLARDSVVYDEAMATSSWTLPSFASILTGTDPAVHETTTIGARLPRALPTLAERLATAGYFTGAIGCNPVLDAGTDVHRGFADRRWFPRPSPGPAVGSRLLEWSSGRAHEWGTEGSTEALTTLARRWLRDNAHHSFFLWLHYFDPHMPYAPPREFLPADLDPRIGASFDERYEIRTGRFLPSAAQRAAVRRLYEAEVRHVDDAIGRLLEELERHDLYDDALIVFASDHGEELWDHGGFEHGHSMHREVIRVPLMIKLPRAAATRRVTAPVSAAAVTPTILELCHVPFEVTEHSVAPLPGLGRDTERGATAEAAAVASMGCVCYEDQDALIFERWKHVVARVSGRETVYDRLTDPLEERPIRDPAVAAFARARTLREALQERARQLREQLGIAGERRQRLDPAVLERLRSLGYR